MTTAPVHITLAADAQCYICSEQMLRGDEAKWWKGKGVSHPDCQETLPEALSEALRALRSALPGLEKPEVSEETILAHLAGDLSIQVLVDKGLVHLKLGVLISTPPEGIEPADFLSWLDEHLVPFLYEQIGSYREAACALERCLGY